MWFIGMIRSHAENGHSQGKARAARTGLYHRNSTHLVLCGPEVLVIAISILGSVHSKEAPVIGTGDVTLLLRISIMQNSGWSL